jgi:NTP pyrophosphatase (non-canonical NTP hydrolase)
MERTEEAKASSIETIAELVEHSHRNARNKGFHDPAPSLLEQIALVHTELSEAVEAYRSPDRRRIDEVWFEGQKPEGIPIELADVVIRVADICGRFEIDLTAAIRLKAVYNESRPRRHGGKRL